MMNLLIGFLVLMAIGFGYALFAAMRAPVGYEDETGFHFGPETHDSAKDLHGALPAFSR